MIDNLKIEKYIDAIREMAGSNPIIDAHVHPFEVLYGGGDYRPVPSQPRLYCTGNSCYKPPAIGPWDTARCGRNSSDIERKLHARVTALFMRQLYAHSGSQCLTDHMDLCGISRAVLLPVLQPGEEDGRQMRLLQEMFGDDSRFAIGYCVPDFVQTENICSVVKAAVESYGAKILKIHPNISRIDPSSEYGRTRIEVILAAAGEHRMKVIIHGGTSPLLDCPERNYGSIHNLKGIQFGMTDQPVILSHACTYGCGTDEVKEMLPIIKKLLSTYPNLMVDISAIELDVLCLLLNNIDHERIIFGSDAFYEMQWRSIVKLLHGLKVTHKKYQDAFIRITSVNASHLFRKEFCHDSENQNEILSIYRTLHGKWFPLSM